MSNEVHLTAEGHAKLKAELDDLKGRTRMRIAEAIREAKAHGDLKENAAYHEAKLNQRRLESRIAELEKALQIAKIVERPDGAATDIHLGSKVKLHDPEFDDTFTVKVVGDFEADAAKGFISINSPMGQALVGRALGDELEVDAPAGTQRFRILAIE
jgi:transcription elongation factor GreA